MRRRTQYSVAFKIDMVEKYLRRDKNITKKSFAARYGVLSVTLATWVVRYNNGELSLDNAIAVSSTPESVVKKLPTLELYVKPETVMYKGKEYIIREVA